MLLSYRKSMSTWYCRLTCKKDSSNSRLTEQSLLSGYSSNSQLVGIYIQYRLYLVFRFIELGSSSMGKDNVVACNERLFLWISLSTVSKRCRAAIGRSNASKIAQFDHHIRLAESDPIFYPVPKVLEADVCQVFEVFPEKSQVSWLLLI